MHTSQVEADGHTYNVHHNGDYSGDVVIYLPPSKFDLQIGKTSTECRVSIPFAVLRSLVADYVRAAKIEALEDADDDQVLDVAPRSTVLHADDVTVQIYRDPVPDEEPPMIVITCDPGMAIVVNGNRIAGPPSLIPDEDESESPSEETAGFHRRMAARQTGVRFRESDRSSE